MLPLITLLLAACSGDTPDTSAPATATIVTVGVYGQEEDGSYVELGVDDLVFEIGLACQAWTRTAAGHDDAGGLDAVESAHDHHNAADETAYDGESVTWTEYGPEHTLSDIASTCAAGADGVTKQVNSTAYYEDKPGVYLRIKDVEER